MQLFEQLGIALLVIIVGLMVYVYFHYIKQGDPLPAEDKDWKKYKEQELDPHIEEDKQWYKAIAVEAEVRAYNTDQMLSVFFKKLANDGLFQWSYIEAVFKYIGQVISWVKYRPIYWTIIVIGIGLFLHYVLGV